MIITARILPPMRDTSGLVPTPISSKRVLHDREAEDTVRIVGRIK
jgi:hypothetical protein